jgi:hypothetical protein
VGAGRCDKLRSMGSGERPRLPGCNTTAMRLSRIQSAQGWSWVASAGEQDGSPMAREMVYMSGVGDSELSQTIRDLAHQLTR